MLKTVFMHPTIFVVLESVFTLFLLCEVLLTNGRESQCNRKDTRAKDEFQPFSPRTFSDFMSS